MFRPWFSGAVRAHSDLNRDICVETVSSFWQEMGRSEKGWRLQADFLQTHPGHRTRARVRNYFIIFCTRANGSEGNREMAPADPRALSVRRRRRVPGGCRLPHIDSSIPTWPYPTYLTINTSTAPDAPTTTSTSTSTSTAARASMG